MTTFIDLLGSVVWSDADITNRTEFVVRQQFNEIDETVLNRKVSGAALGAYTLTAEDQAEIAHFGQVTQAAGLLGVQARADMALLQTALDYEAAERRLALPEFDGPETVEVTDMEGNVTTVPNPAFVQDQAERSIAESLLTSSTQETLDLVALRRPPILEPTVEPEAHDA
jgi:hypothetical protein